VVGWGKTKRGGKNPSTFLASSSSSCSAAYRVKSTLPGTIHPTTKKLKKEEMKKQQVTKVCADITDNNT
jgi:hypothetical protein